MNTKARRSKAVMLSPTAAVSAALAAWIGISPALSCAQKSESLRQTDSKISSTRDDNDEIHRYSVLQQEDVPEDPFFECFPMAARILLVTSSGEPYSDEEISRRAQALGPCFSGVPDMLLTSLKALGVRANEDWGVLDESYSIVFEALKGVDIEQVLSALPRIEKDELAFLGAARLFFDPSLDFVEELDRDEWREWVPRLTDTALSDGSASNQHFVTNAIARRELPAATKLLRSIADNGLLADPAIGQYDIGTHELALLALAQRNDQSIRETVENRLGEATRKLDIAALEVCMALLGEPEYLRASHFELRSVQIELSALKAIEKYSGRHGVDILVYSALAQPYVYEEAFIVLQRLSGQRWLPDGVVQRHNRMKYAQNAAAWWRANPQAFEQPYVAHDNFRAVQ